MLRNQNQIEFNQGKFGAIGHPEEENFPLKVVSRSGFATKPL